MPIKISKLNQGQVFFGSDRSPRCQDVCLCDIMPKGTAKEFWRVKMSSSSILKHPGGVLGQAGKQASKQTGRQAGKEATVLFIVNTSLYRIT